MKNKKKRIIIGSIVFMFLASSLVGLTQFFINGMNLENEQQEFLEELENNKGTYDEKSIILNDTSYHRAKELSEKLNAKLRIVENGDFATLTLKDGTIVDIVKEDDNKTILNELSIDYQVATSDVKEEKFTPVKPNYTVNDEYYSLQSYLDYINIGDAWKNSSYKGSNITIAVIDTGIDTDHKEFKNRISEYSYNATEDKIVKDHVLDDGSYDWSLIEDEQGHGTSVTGVIAASMNNEGITGILPNVNILTIKAECDELGNFKRTSDLVFGLYYAIERDVQVVNMSFGAPFYNPYEKPAKLAVDSDIILVAAAGNESTSGLTYPAADPNVIGVGALAENSYELANYSNYGENTDIVAPGTVYTTMNDGGYGQTQGTSLSSPIVAASIGLYLSKNKYQTFEDVTERLYASTKDIGSLGKDWLYGYGLLDVNALIEEEVGKVTFNMLSEEVESINQIFIRNHTLQNIPEPERLYAVFDGWYYDIHCSEELNWYEDTFSEDLTLYAKWVNEDDGVPYTYVELEDGTIEIRSYTGKRKFITIPDKIKDKEVSSIGDGAFVNQSRLRLVNLPSNLKIIKRSAFEGCNNLSRISLPDSLEYIEENAFKDNIRLSYVQINEESSLKKIGNNAFTNCTSLNRFNITEKVEEVSANSFLATTSMKAYDVSKNNTYFSSKDGVLMNKSRNTVIAYPAGLNGEYEVPSKVVTISASAFAYSKIKNIDLNNVNYIGDSAFMLSSLEAIDILDSVTTVGSAAFYGCSSLSNVKIGKGLTNINSDVFFSCIALKEIIIPSNIIEIGAKAFKYSGLEKIEFEKDSNLLIISIEAFSYTPLNSISIPDSVINIGSSAFKGCTYLQEVNIGENSNLQSIDGGAFKDTISLQSITLPKQLISLGDYAFINSGISGSVTLPASLEYFGIGAFASCHNLENIYVDDENSKFLDIEGVVYNTDKTELLEYPAGNTNSTYQVEETVEKIGDAAFYGSYNLTSVSLPSNLKIVGEYGFYECINIQSYTLPTSLENIERYAFSYNISLRTLAIPDNVVQISNYAFYGDYNLYSITFNETSKLTRLSFASFAYTGITSFRVTANVSTIAQYVFEGCDKLKTITFSKNSKLESISGYMFLGCDNLENIIFEEGSKLTNIEAHAFEGMTKLKSIDFGDAKINNIDNFAFRYCESLENINIVDTVTYIGRYAFYMCSSLSEIILPISIEYIGENAFYGTNNINVYFQGDVLPFYLQENWDNGIGGYYLSTNEIVVNGDYEYTIMNNGCISIVKYNGNDTNIDLNNLNLGGDIISIGGYAFYRSTVQSITLPNTLTSIQRYAFAYTNIKEIIIPNNVVFIGQYAFYNSEIEVVTFENNSSVYTIEKYAFSSLENLKSIVLPKSLYNLGQYAFYKSGLEVLEFEDNSVIEVIPKCAFMSTNIINVKLPDSLKLIDHSAFRDNLSLTFVTFGTSELQIMSNAFYNTGLVSIYIPENVTYIGEYAFVGLVNLTTFEVSINNEYYSEIDGALYSKDGTKIIAYPAGRTNDIILPESLEEIGFGAFENSKVSKVIFNENSNVLSIGYRAFFNASNLVEINVPASVVSIDYYAFAYCKNLRTVTFMEGNKLTGVYEGAFYGCSLLTNISLPNTIKEISDFAFYGCKSLKKMPIDSTCELFGIYDYAFAYSGIETVILPDSLIDIGNYAFKATKIKNVTIPDAKKEELILGIGIFEECNYLERITVPFIGASFEDEKITWFGYIFGAGSYEVNNSYIPTSLKTVEISDGINKIGVGAFYGVENIDDVIIPGSVNEIHFDSFNGVTFEYELLNTISFYDKKGNLIDNISKEYFGKNIRGTLIIGDSVTSIGSSAFSGCTKLEEIVLPNSVTSIGGYAFRDCANLIKVKLSPNITVINESTFENCTNLVSVDNLGEIISIGQRAFYNCQNLSSIEIPDSVISIGNSCFYKCTSLTDIDLPIALQSIGSSAFSGCSKLEEIVIPNSVTSIGSWAFYNCTSLTSIEIPNSVTSIGGYAFRDCANLIKVKLSPNITVINEYTFENCANLVSVDNLGGIISIGQRAFYNCQNLSSIEIPDSVISIGNSCFYKCTSLTDIDLPITLQSIGSGAFSGCSKLEEIIIPDSVTSIGGYAFEDCANLIKVKLSPKITIINESTFDNCINLESVEIFEGITSIGQRAFANCQKLLSINLANGLISIESYAFYNCRNLTSITLPESLKSISSNAFGNCSLLSEINNNSNISITIGDTSNGYVGYYAYFIYNKDGSIQFKNSDSIITKDKFIFRYKNSQYTLYAYIGDEETITLPELFNGETYTIKFERLHAKNVIVPEGITKIGTGAFSGCERLVSITLPSTLESIGEGAFSSCINLESIVIPEGVKVIAPSTFNMCKKLESVIINGNVTSIGQSAFFSCESLKNIEFPNSLTTIGLYAFQNCDSLTSIVIPEGVTVVNSWAFYDCDNLVNISIPSTLTSIGYYTFSKCISLVNIVIPEGVTMLEDFAFKECTNLVSVSLPSTLKTINSGVFEKCYNLVDLKIHENNQSFKVIEGNIYNSNGNQLLFYLNTHAEIVTLPEGVTSIKGGAFSNCVKLKKVILPNSMAFISDYAFQNCSSLESVVIPEGVISIGYCSFENCSNLISIDIPNSVTSIDSFAFANCTSLVSVKLPNQLKYLSTRMFENCVSLTNIEIPETIIEVKAMAFMGCSSLVSLKFPSTLEKINGSAFSGCSSLVSIDIPNNTEWNGSSIFSGCSSLRSVELSDNLTSIEHGTFSGCSSLEKIEIPSLVTYIEAFAFDECTNLKDIVIPEGVTSIGQSAFEGCTSLISIIIPEGVTTIERNAFYNCSSLTSIKLPSTLEIISNSMFSMCNSLINVDIAYGVKKIDNYSFSRCNSLVNLKLPDSITSIGEYAFHYCKKLESIKLSENLTSIGDNAFSYCGLRSIEIPKSVKYLGHHAFYYCSNLENVVMNDGITNIDMSTFYYCKMLISVILPSTLENIGTDAFNGCQSLSSITLPESLSNISTSAFYDCKQLYEVVNNSNLEITLGSKEYGYVGYYAYFIYNKDGSIQEKYNNNIRKDEFIFSYDETDGYILYAYLGNAETITLPESINGSTYKIKFNIFNSKNVIIPESITVINEDAFRNCKTLETITLPSTLVSIESHAFYNCDKLTSIEIPNGVISIGDSAFSNCDNLSNIEIPSSVTSIGDSAFSGCSSLTSIEIPSSVTSIGYSAFSGCSSLTSIEIPSSIIFIEGYTFDGCINLVNIVIPSSVISIGSCAFRNCSSLSNIILPEGIMEVGSNAFENCEKLEFNVYNNSYYLGSISNPYYCLYDVDDNSKELKIHSDTRIVHKLAFKNVDKLKTIELPIKFWSTAISSQNLETIIFSDLSDYGNPNYFPDQPLTLKNIVLRKGCNVKAANIFSKYSNIQIFVEESKENVMWDYDYPNWNNGNKVYYDGEWISANFYDENKKLISSEYYSIHEIIKQPYYEVNDDKKSEYSFVGWDTNNDGISDFIPATYTNNIEAYAVLVNESTKYTVSFYDYDNSLIDSIELPYGSAIELINNPEREGYEFTGWEGYYEGIIVTSSISFYATYEHIGGSHSYSKETIAPTCENDGYDLYRCDLCHEEYKDNYVSKLGHNYGEYIVDKEATCKEDGHKYRECISCGHIEEMVIDSIDHDYEEVIIKDSTCVEHGIVEYRCKTCNDTYTEELMLNEHSYEKKYVSKSWIRIIIEYFFNIIYGYEGDQAYYYECSVCGKKLEKGEEASIFATTSKNEDCDHSSYKWIKEIDPNCLENGLEICKCEYCDHTINFRFIDATGHDLTYHEGKDPTCIEQGYKAYEECSKCSYSTYEEIAAHGHNYVSVVTDPTCIEQGYTTHTCETCGYSYKDAYIEATGHSYGDWYVVKEASCVEKGLEQRDCSCGHSETKETEVHGHNYVSVVTNPTCIEQGYTTHTCEKCGDSYIDTYIEATGHSYGEWYVVNEPSCEGKGLEQRDCSCGHSETKETEAYGHNYVSEVTEPTCIEQGYTTHTCERCGDSYKDTYIEATGHSYGDWYVVNEPSCEEKGLEQRDCSCGHSETREIEAHGHNYVSVVTDPTCIEQGYTTHTCERCGDSYKDAYIEATGHDLTHHEGKDATCEEAGYKAYEECSKCNYSTYEEIEATGHNYEWVDSDKTTDEGKPMEDYKCEHCGHIKDTREKGNKELIVVGVIFGGILLIACYFIFKPKY